MLLSAAGLGTAKAGLLPLLLLAARLPNAACGDPKAAGCGVPNAGAAEGLPKPGTAAASMLDC